MNNEQRLENELSFFFNKLYKKVSAKFNEYWSEYNLMQGQIDLITAPILEAHDEYYNILVKHIKREYQLGSDEAGRLVELASTKQANKNIKSLLFNTNPKAEDDLLSKVFTASERTLRRVTSKINKVLSEGYTSGAGINVVGNLLTEQFNQLKTWEAKRIARTEIHNSHNLAVMDTYNSMNVSYTQWIAANDDKTRDSHAEIDGEIIPIGETYSNGLRYPGDTDGPIDEWINCRCSNAPFVVPYGYIAPNFSPFREEDLIEIGGK